MFRLGEVGAWAVRVDNLDGIIRIGDPVIFKLAREESPLLVVTGHGSRSAKPAATTVDLLVRVGAHLALDRFVGGIVETSDPL